MTQRMTPAAGLLLVIILGLTTGGLTYVTERVLCTAAPDVPFLNAGCDMDAMTLSLIIGGGAAVVGLVGLVVSTARTRDR